ncbi:hypothetical protein [uncultured Enterococcus sp.]|uniref:hypothetical protein n=1 Tax=uncultured Enterococcus sp. TaxID=167972 RepID=UPI002AA81656|nr:hypothetical protein [uncultured Enterococcus sp.]
MDSENSTDIWATEDPEVYNKFYGGEENKKKYYDMLEESKDLTCYEYDYFADGTATGKDVWRIYFIDKKVVWMYFY